MTIKLGKAAPNISLPDSSGKLWKLKDAAGKKLVVYFYPRDNTPGCTREGADFAALFPVFKKARTQIVGISADSIESHLKFRNKMLFPFELLADTDHKVCELYGVYKEKTLYGRKFMGIERSTFLIDADGMLRHEWRKVKVQDHAAAVLAAAQQL
jgi:thioredoxin-dependent peroxiredoxin